MPASARDLSTPSILAGGTPSMVRWQLRVVPGGGEEAACPSLGFPAMRIHRRLGSGLIRMVDLLAAGVGLVVTAPLLAGLAILVKLSSPGPVLMGEERVGPDRRHRPRPTRGRPPVRSGGRRREDRGGRIFRAYRFRIIAADPERAVQVWTSHRDPRMTGVGHLLRRYRLDELPLLWNVLKGDMSMVSSRRASTRILRDSLEVPTGPDPDPTPPVRDRRRNRWSSRTQALHAEGVAGESARANSPDPEGRSLLGDLGLLARDPSHMIGERSSM